MPLCLYLNTRTVFGADPYETLTVLVSDPALDLRSLSLSLATKGAPVSAETTRRIENAILTRARQLRQRDEKL